MGFALAARAAELGAEVCLVCGPVNQPTPPGNIRRIDVVSARQMLEACQNEFTSADITIMSAAVADFTPLHPSEKKIKKTAKSTSLQIELKPTTDILAYLGLHKKPGQILVGFALETDNEIENALKKLHTKNLDLIVLNSMNDKGAGFGTPANKVSMISTDGKIHTTPLLSKEEIALLILKQITDIFPVNITD